MGPFGPSSCHPATTPGAEHPPDPYGQRLVIIVGQGGAEGTFVVEQSIICHYSGYFKGMCAMINWGNGEVRLPGESQKTFGFICNYLQVRSFFPMQASNICPCWTITFDEIIDIWMFGDRRIMPVIQNAAIDLLADKIRCMKALPDRWSIEWIWEKTEQGSQLRKMLVEFVRAMWVPDGHRHHIWKELAGGMSYDPERLIWAIEELYASNHEVRLSGKTLTRLQACEWHIHAEGDYCEGSEEASLGRRGEYPDSSDMRQKNPYKFFV